MQADCQLTNLYSPVNAADMTSVMSTHPTSMTDTEMTDAGKTDESQHIIDKLVAGQYNDIRPIIKLSNSGQLRDYDNLYTNPTFYRSLVSLYTRYTAQYDKCVENKASAADMNEALSELQSIYTLLVTILNYTEFSPHHSHHSINKQFTDRIVGRFNSRHVSRMGGAGGLASVPQAILHSVGVFNQPADQTDTTHQQEYAYVRSLAYTVYHRCAYIRPVMRSQVVSFVSRFCRSPSTAGGIGDVLAIWSAIINGCIAPLKSQYTETLHKYIMQMHTIDHAVLQQFHDRLTYCIISYIKRDSSLSVPILSKLISLHSTQHSGKHVLILHEVESVLELMDNSQLQEVLTQFMQFLIVSLQNVQFQVAERAAQLFQNDKFTQLVKENAPAFVDALISVLCTKHWNKTVEQMYQNILYILYAADRQYVLAALTKQLQFTSTEQARQYCDKLFKAHEAGLVGKKVVDKAISIPDKLQNVKYSDFVFGDTLGAGSFSTVYLARYVRKGKGQSEWPEYAVKVINKANLMSHDQFLHNFNNEVQCLNVLSHPNITQLIGLCENPTNWYMVLEYAKLGDLHTLISANGSLDLKSAVFFAAELLLALKYIHQSGFVYSDLKPENVVVHENGHIKLIDFGSTRQLSSVALTDKIEGTVEYLAPELASHTHPIGVASDLWSYGCVLYQMLAGRPFVFADADTYVDNYVAEHEAAVKAHDSVLFEDDESVDLGVQSEPAAQLAKPAEPISDVEQQKLERQHILQKLTQFRGATDDMFPDSFPAAAKSLIMRLLVADPAHRLTDYAIIQADQLFADIQFDTLSQQAAPAVAVGAVKAAQVDSKWSRRKNSIMWAPNLPKYEFKDSAWVMDAIPESVDEADSSADRQNGSATSSRRHVTTRVADLSSDRMSGITESDEKQDSDDDSDYASGSALMSKLGRQVLPPPASQHIPAVIPSRISLPPRAPALPSSRKMGSGTSSRLLQSMMKNKAVAQADNTDNKQ